MSHSLTDNPMAIVKFTSIDKEARTVTFDVDSNPVTRKIPDQFVGSIDEHIEALAKGLAVEAGIAAQTAKVIETPLVKSGDVLVG